MARIRWGRALWLLGGVVGLLFGINAGLGFWALRRVEAKIGGSIEGAFLPHLFEPAFTLRHSRWSWKERFEIARGTFHVRYDPFSLIPSRPLRLWIEGSDLEVHFLAEGLPLEGLSQVEVEEVKAHLALSEEGPPEIFSLQVRSPQLEFDFLEKEPKIKTDETQRARKKPSSLGEEELESFP